MRHLMLDELVVDDLDTLKDLSWARSVYIATRHAFGYAAREYEQVCSRNTLIALSPQ